MRLRRQITRMMSPVDILRFSQFTLDWLQELDDADNSGDTTDDEQTDNLALAYEIDTIREVLRYGQDKALFDMLATYARFCMPNAHLSGGTPSAPSDCSAGGNS